MNPFVSEDWRKQASMTAANDLDIEKAFSDQASGFVENKVGDLMKDEYRIGFEIVKKNDSNTRMVGIFAFKVDKDLIFAPVFFINGEIKGPLLYRASSKMFVPADKEWASYLIDSMERRDGSSRPKSSLNESAPLVQMQRLTFNPVTGMGKRASSDVVDEPSVQFEVKPVTSATDSERGVYVIQKSLNTKPGEQPKLSNGCSVLKMASAEDGTIRMYLNNTEVGYVTKSAAAAIEEECATTINCDAIDVQVTDASATTIKHAFFDGIPDNSEQWDTMLDAVSKQASISAGLTSEFLKEPGFGKAAAELIVKAASDYNFAEALAGLYPDPNKLFPESYNDFQKKASNEGGLEICYTTDDLEKSASVGKRYFADGFYIKDTRPTETMSVVFQDAPGNLTAPDSPGVYSLLKDNGEFIDNVIVAPVSDKQLAEAVKRNFSGIVAAPVDYDRDEPKYVAIKDGAVCEFSNNVFGIYTGEISDSSALKDTVNEKGVYLIYLKDKVLGPIAVTEKNVTDGVTRIKMVQRGKYSSVTSNLWLDNWGKTVIINPDLSVSDVDNGVLGKDAKFIRLDKENRKSDSSWSSDDAAKVFSPKPLEGIGSSVSVNNWIFSKFNTSKVKVERDAYSEKKAYTFSDGVRTSSPMNRLEALVKMSRDMGMSATASYRILDSVDLTGSEEFFLAPTEKVASRLSLVDRPIFDDEFDSEFGVPMQPTKKYKLRVQGDQEMAPASAIGDMWNPTSATGLPDLTVATTAPEDLRALADTYHLPHVFEHGMIGTLADTFNAISLIDKYIPKLEEGVDALGRTKFLLHWCPNDFEKAYGRDDMASLEAEVDTNFEELGALLLKLIKKAEKNKKADIKFENQ